MFSGSVERKLWSEMGYGKLCKRYQKRLFGSTIFAQVKGQYMMT